MSTATKAPTTADLIPRVIDYLRTCGVFDGKPIFEKKVWTKVCTDPRGHWDEYIDDPRFWQDAFMEYHKAQFNALDSPLDRIRLDQVMDLALETIPDSPNTVVIDIGSDYGIAGGGFIAAHKPNAEVILVDKPHEELYFPGALFANPRGIRNRLVFNIGEHIVKNIQDMETRVNRLYKANGINNVRYVECELAEDNFYPSFLQGINKDVYLFSLRSPMCLPFLVAALYNRMGAKFMCVSPTGQDRNTGDSHPWKVIQRNLNLTDQEAHGYFVSAFDSAPLDEPSTKFDYNDEAQRRIGTMIKFGFALVLAKEVDGRVLRNSVMIPEVGYGQADHYIIAER